MLKSWEGSQPQPNISVFIGGGGVELAVVRSMLYFIFLKGTLCSCFVDRL